MSILVELFHEKTLEELQKLQKSTDIEQNHWDADNLLCNFLKILGYQDIVDAYEQIDKWYS